MKHHPGFIALTSAIIISVVLLSITVSVGFTGLFSRLTIADSESKEQSYAAADSCIHQSLLAISQGSSGPNHLNVGAARCDIKSISANTPNTGQTTIITQSAVNQAYTTLQAIVNSYSLAVISFSECPTLSDCP